MKKYQQLLIVSLGLLSFISFLIYKHEYDRLRNVLEVLEVFGSPPPPITKFNMHNKKDVQEVKGIVDPEQEIKGSGEVIDPPDQEDLLLLKKRKSLPRPNNNNSFMKSKIPLVNAVA
jgi:hypothetical protein